MAHTQSIRLDASRPDLSVEFVPDWLRLDSRREVGAELRDHAGSFEGGSHLVDGRPVPTPRLVAAFGDDAYAYPDMGASLPWSPNLRGLRDRLQAESGQDFNYALVNWYRDGSDYTGWHSDKIDLHVPETRIAIISIGASRTLSFRAIGASRPAREVELSDGSLLWMSCELQRHFEHAVAPAPQANMERFSITFRNVVPPA